MSCSCNDPMVYEVKVWSNGYKAWYQNGQLHRLDGPTIEYDKNGHKEWYQNGQLHRLDGPAIEYADGYKAWYQNGQRHRLDGPAVESDKNGNKEWYQNGQRHRLDVDGPAIEDDKNGYKAWYQNGQRHRLDGPAVEYAGGDKEWWINGTYYSNESTWEEAVNKLTKAEEEPSCNGKYVEIEGKKYKLMVVE